MAVALGSMKTDPATGLLGIWCYYAQCEVENYSPFLPSRAQFSLGISVVFVVRFTHTHTLAPLPSLSLPCSSPNSTTTAHKGRHGFTDFSFTCTTTAWHKCTVGSLIIAHLFPSVSPSLPSLPPSLPPLMQWSGRQPPPGIDAPPSIPLLRHIINQAYSRAVTSPEDLNSYEPFSPEVHTVTTCSSHLPMRAPLTDWISLLGVRRDFV